MGDIEQMYTYMYLLWHHCEYTMGDIEQCTPICTCYGTIVSILWEILNNVHLYVLVLAPL